jgi:apolipoprotein N-acyltransferase
LILSFPDFGLWPLAWLALTPLLLAIAKRPASGRAFILGWLAGTVFFYGSCYWLTYSMIHYGGLSPWLAYLLLVPGAVIVGVFPAAFAAVLARCVYKWRNGALFLAPLIWVTFEWLRLEVTGQLWNAIGYSQAYHPALIQTARLGGVYAVGFLIVAVNAAVVFLFVNRSRRALVISSATVLSVTLVLLASYMSRRTTALSGESRLQVVALQPNVPMDLVKSTAELQQLNAIHFVESANALRQLPQGDIPRLVIWPESPMNFSYGTDPVLQDKLSRFAIDNQTSLLFNSQEVAPGNGSYNSALLINEKGRLIAQYDKIRLLPFGEYVPLPRWLPGASLITAIVGDFTPGDKYTLMPVGTIRAGTFICIESAYPSVARAFAGEGADLLINISNDGYLGPTAVMRQHLGNAIFRAVENGRPLLRVTNTGISAYITPEGEVKDETAGFQKAIRMWTVSPAPASQTFFTRYGNLFAWICAGATLLSIIASIGKRKNSLKAG